jgi:hypothetical protein
VSRPAGITPAGIIADGIAPPVPAERPGVGIEPADLGFPH